VRSRGRRDRFIFWQAKEHEEKKKEEKRKEIAIENTESTEVFCRRIRIR